MKGNMILLIGVLALMILPHFAMAVDFDQEPSAEDKATFDQMLEPVMKIYTFVKYFASVLAGVVLLIAGVMYMTAGADPKKRDTGKAMAMYVVIGLIIIWAAPMIVQLLAG